MNVFITGASGFIGMAIAAELIQAGHHVTGLARSEQTVQRLNRIGADAHRGELKNLLSLTVGARAADAVIHCAYDHAFAHPQDTAMQEMQAIAALGKGLLDSTRPLLITSVAAMGSRALGQLASEDFYDPSTQNPRKSTEIAAAQVADSGVNVSIIRLPQVHNEVKQGFVSALIQLAREKGVSAYVEEGNNQWAAAHVADVASLYRIVLEKALPGRRYHAVAEQGISLRNIAEDIGAGLGVPVVQLTREEASAHFGWLALFVSMDMRASGELTRQRTGWQPSHPGLLQDLERYFRLA